jgi:hypothetical protein
MRYEPPAINFHLGETPPQGAGEQATASGILVHQSDRNALEFASIANRVRCACRT